MATTDRAFSFVTADGRLASIIRTRIAPAVLADALSFHSAREYLFRSVSQITLNYRDMALSAGRAGDVAGGDRLPWVSVDGTDNHEPLTAIAWQVHVYGTARQALTNWCHAHGLSHHAFVWHPAYEQAGLARDALYLIRPDSYVALAEPSGDPCSIERYFADRQIQTQGISS